MGKVVLSERECLALIAGLEARSLEMVEDILEQAGVKDLGLD